MIKGFSSLDFGGVDEKFQACQSYSSSYDFQILLSPTAEREEIVIYQMTLAFPPTPAPVLSEKSQCPRCPFGGEEEEGEDIQTLRWHSYGMLHWIPAQPELRLNSKRTHK